MRSTGVIPHATANPRQRVPIPCNLEGARDGSVPPLPHPREIGYHVHMQDVLSVHQRAQRIEVIAFDVDGVCTDGKLYYGPNGEMLHAFHARDGLGMARARVAGIVLCAISGRASQNVLARMQELRVPHVLQGIADKTAALAGVLEQEGKTFAQAAFIGDDINDLPLLKTVGLAACVADAVPQLPPCVHLVTRNKGGEGALRELIEAVLVAQGRWT